jgi:hypothetical protein
MNFDDYECKERAKYELFAVAGPNILDTAIRAGPANRLQQIQHREKDPTSLKNQLAKFGASDSDKIEDVVKAVRDRVGTCAGNGIRSRCISITFSGGR